MSDDDGGIRVRVGVGWVVWVGVVLVGVGVGVGVGGCGWVCGLVWVGVGVGVGVGVCVLWLIAFFIGSLSHTIYSVRLNKLRAAMHSKPKWWVRREYG